MPKTSTVSIPSSASPLFAYLAEPDGDGPFPGVVVIHEIHGLNDDIKSIAERFAGEGYVALAVDLYAGRNRALCMVRLMSGMLLNSLHHAGIGDLKATLNSLESRPNVDATRLGAIGFCLGGNLSICWACTDPRLKVIAPFYGMNPRPLEAVARACPVVGSYPEQDFTAGAARKLDIALERYKVPHDVKIYPGARHSFFNRDGRSYDKAASADAWQRTLEFFREQLKVRPSL
jgi:carboxymethylenebutenolidase